MGKLFISKAILQDKSISNMWNMGDKDLGERSKGERAIDIGFLLIGDG